MLSSLVAEQAASTPDAASTTPGSDQAAAGLDLKGQDLRKADLQSLNLKGADLSGANLSASTSPGWT